jgi:ribosome assembly protein YihI (activator of Der GTPase)
MARSMRIRSKTGGRKRRPASSARKQPRRAASTPWPIIEEFLDTGEGDITLGAINHSSLRYTAVATDHHNMLVALVRDRGETLHQLLDRLEQALGPALEDQIYVDEINRP